MALSDHTEIGAPAARLRDNGIRPVRPSFLDFWTPARAEGRIRTVPPPAAASADELNCLRDVLAPGLLRAAARRAGELNIGADRVLIQWGVIDEQAYVRRLAGYLGIAVEDFTLARRRDCPLPDAQFAHAGASGLLPLRRDGTTIWVISPQRLGARMLTRSLAAAPEMKARTRVASAEALQQFIIDNCAAAWAEAATSTLHRRMPAMSAAPRGSPSPWPQRLRRGGCVLAMLVVPLLLWDLACDLLALSFLSFAALRLVASLWRQPAQRPSPRRPDRALPIYTVVAALYREAKSVAPLLAAIDALDYPHEKLDVIVVVEPDDLATRVAIARLPPRPHLRLVVAPAVAPQTKPKALNCALAFARGSFIVVFDAEDRPEPGQLRDALAAFDSGGIETACVQASLCIDNVTHSWLSRTFVAEYAGQFDRFLHGLAAFGLPLPLGGTSNHFQTAVLRAVGGWDPYNVTEDADLGFRLARFGYRCVPLRSTTYEEAPVSFGNWLRQRSRWMKGWIQTWQVHMRDPPRLWRDLGPSGFAAFNLIVGGNVLTALAYPFLLVSGLTMLVGGTNSLNALLSAPPSPLYLVTIGSGLLATVVIGLLGLAARRKLRFGWVLALTPLYWLCLSLAAWRALAQFIWCPYRWEKTSHGIAERDAGRCPAVPQSRTARPQTATASASDRRRPPRASA